MTSSDQTLEVTTLAAHADALRQRAQRAEAEVERLREAATEAIRQLETLPSRPPAAQLLDVRVGLRLALDAR